MLCIPERSVHSSLTGVKVGSLFFGGQLIEVRIFSLELRNTTDANSSGESQCPRVLRV